MATPNTPITAVLRSPFHGMMSRSLLLLTYEGRRSRKEYTLPLQYVEDAGTLYVWAGAADTKTWWRNFATPAAVTIRLRGKDVLAKAYLVDDAQARARLLRAYMDRYPYTTMSGRPKFVGKRWHPTDADLAEAAASTVMVAIEPG